MEPFIKKGKYSSFAYLDRESFKFLVVRLGQIGFNEINIITPSTVISGDRKVQDEHRNKILTLDAFLALDRNFPSIILFARNTENNDELRILFKDNSDRKVTFSDDIFSYIDKNKKFNFYISSYSIERTYSLFNFIKDFFKEQVVNVGILVLLSSITALVLLSGLFLLQSKNDVIVITSVLGPALWFLVFLKLLPKTGLYTSTSKRIRSYPVYIEELRKNWLVILVTFLLTSFGGYVLHLLKII